MFEAAHIPFEFHQLEYLSTEEWAWLSSALSAYGPAQLIIVPPPSGADYNRALAARHPPAPPAPAEGSQSEWGGGAAGLVRGPVPRPFSVRIAWDGTLTVFSEGPKAGNYHISNINELADPLATLLAL